ncbi:MAG: hypothetical protein ACPG4K_10240 [Haloferula sp.]
MTLTELALVIMFMLVFAVILMTGARAWKRGSDRAGCILNLQAVQKAVRGYGNMSGRNPGDTVVGLEAEVVGAGLFFEQLPTCPAGGTYSLGGNTIPAVGTLYMRCSLSGSEKHEPEDLLGW